MYQRGLRLDRVRTSLEILRSIRYFCCTLVQGDIVEVSREIVFGIPTSLGTMFRSSRIS